MPCTTARCGSSSNTGAASNIAPKRLQPGRIVQLRLPTIERIVVAVTDERANARLVQSLQALDELELRTEATVFPVVHVARDEQRVHPLVDAQVDDVLIGRERSGVERVRHVVGGLPPSSR